MTIPFSSFFLGGGGFLKHWVKYKQSSSKSCPSLLVTGRRLPVPSLAPLASPQRPCGKCRCKSPVRHSGCETPTSDGGGEQTTVSAAGEQSKRSFPGLVFNFCRHIARALAPTCLLSIHLGEKSLPTLLKDGHK